LLNNVSTPTVEQAAQYIEDRWQITKNILLCGGLPNEQVTNFNGEGMASVLKRRFRLR
jgi:hypothetical protein